MTKDTLTLQIRPRYISGLADNIQKYFKKEDGIDYPVHVIDDALQTWLESRFDRMIEGLGEVITSPHLAESKHFREILEARMIDDDRPVPASVPAPAVAVESIFTGARAFSPDKLGAMIEYIAAKGRDIYKTNLNKLLFYGDMTAYYLHGRGISGATYVNLPYGPVPDTVETVIDDLTEASRIRRVDVPGRGVNAQMIKPSESAVDHSSLSRDEIEVLDWVLDTYGNMSPTEISDLSHSEKAYKFTRPQEPIAYEYAKFFQKLPPKADNQKR